MNKDIEFGYIISIVGVSLSLIWIGIFKFTPTEAELIKALVANSPLMSHLYDFISIDTASKLIGSIEVIIGFGLIISLFKPKFGFIFGAISSVTFLLTLSFLFTTPGVWKIVDGVPVTDFFLLKDIVFFGVSVSIFERSLKYLNVKINFNNSSTIPE